MGDCTFIPPALGRGLQARVSGIAARVGVLPLGAGQGGSMPPGERSRQVLVVQGHLTERSSLSPSAVRWAPAKGRTLVA